MIQFAERQSREDRVKEPMKESLSAARNAVILIPSLEPDNRLPSYIRKLSENGFGHIVVVDDGSSDSYQHIFTEVESTERATVLHHDVNRGKGVALKTGYQYILQHLSDAEIIITADADGQHTVPDCIRLAEEARKGEKALYLGSRDFTLPNIPPKSRSGNRITSAVFKLLYGQYLPDTQTGLRAIPFEHLKLMTEVDGDRYEYETNQFFAVKHAGIQFKEAVIETVYLEENQTSHFRPIRDSIRIYGIIIKYILSSLASTLVDVTLFTILNLLFGKLGLSNELRIPLATGIARLTSSFVNFSVNRKVVFKSRDNYGATMVKYYILCVCQYAASAGLLYLFSTIVFRLSDGSLFDTLIKVVVDTFLFFLSFRIQQNWVFVRKNKKTDA